MEDNYYSNLLTHIKNLIAQDDFKNAKDLIEEELRLPYVPKDVLEELEQLKQDVYFAINDAKPNSIMTPSEVYDALYNGKDNAFKALETLSQANIRNYLPEIEELLVKDEVNRTLKSLLIEQLQFQQVNNIITYKDNEKIFSLIPSELPGALSQKNFNVVSSMLDKYIPNNPSFLTQAKMVLANVAYDKYPVLISDEDVEKVTFSIIKYVYQAYGDIEGFDEFANLYSINIGDLEDYSF